jgi:cytochrome c peroxidase
VAPRRELERGATINSRKPRMFFRKPTSLLLAGSILLSGALLLRAQGGAASGKELDPELIRRLQQLGFTGNIQATLQQRLERPLDPARAKLGRQLWFDTITGLHNDNTCAGCHSPTRGFGDTQSIAIGIDNNGIVGPDRRGPRNQRRTPMAINTAFYPNLMWNSRFASLAADPFDNRSGFLFPPPEDLSLSYLPHLLVAQAFIPPTERTEVAGFEFPGDNDAIRAEVLRRLNAIPAYRTLFGQVFPEVSQGAPITFDMFGSAIAEFEFTLVFADAPIDQYARGYKNALTTDQKKGAMLFFGKARCVECHAVSGHSNEMFSDFNQHVLGVPQIAPMIGNVVFDGDARNEDFGLEQITGNAEDRYKFRTSPLRNVALQPAFFHNGAFTRLEDAVRHHLDVFTSGRSYDPIRAGVASDLTILHGPIEPVLTRIDPLLATPISLTDDEFRWLVDFVREGLLDKRARPEQFRKLVPKSVPSGRPTLVFQFDDRPDIK